MTPGRHLIGQRPATTRRWSPFRRVDLFLATSTTVLFIFQDFFCVVLRYARYLVCEARRDAFWLAICDIHSPEFQANHIPTGKLVYMHICWLRHYSIYTGLHQYSGARVTSSAKRPSPPPAPGEGATLEAPPENNDETSLNFPSLSSRLPELFLVVLRKYRVVFSYVRSNVLATYAGSLYCAINSAQPCIHWVLIGLEWGLDIRYNSQSMQFTVDTIHSRYNSQ